MGIESDLQRVWQRSVDAGLPLPPELALAAELGVSRPTVREALIKMEASGLVRRYPGKGTFANALAQEFPVRLDQSFEFSEVLRAAGLTAQMEVLDSGWVALDTEAAEQLRVAEGSTAFRTLKLWRANGEAAMVADDLIPVRTRRKAAPDARASVFELIDLLRGNTVEWEGAQVDPVLPAADTADQLGIPSDQPVLRLTIVGASRHGERLYRAVEHHDTRRAPYGILRSVL